MRKVASTEELLSEHLTFAGKTIVDVGSGTGDLVRWMVGAGARAVTGIDTPEMLERARSVPAAGSERYLPGGGEALPLPDGCADLVTWIASLHHVPEGRLTDAVRETARVLRPGGQVAFLEPVAEPGSYYTITRLAGDEAAIQKSAHAAILAAASYGLRHVSESFSYLSRSFADYEELVAVFVDDAALRGECLAGARAITERLAAEAGIAFDAYRYRSICRLDVLTRA